MVVVFVLQPAAGLYFKKFFESDIKVGTLVSQYSTESIFLKKKKFLEQNIFPGL